MSARYHTRSRRQKPREGFMGHLLDPIDVLAEAIFSILILLTFTLAFRILMMNPGEPVTAAHIRDLTLAALGATVAWGIIDGVMYALIEILGRSERHRILWHIQAANTEQEAIETIADEFDFILEPITGDSQRQALYQDILDHLHDSQPRAIGLKREDFTGALASVLVALLAVAPSFLPLFIFRNDYALAIRLSNVVSFIMLFVAGYQWGNYTGMSSWKTGLLVVAVGVLLVAVAIPLGG
ncbi:VIT1/CCC1 transporter family protein [Promineifilum sp.]|uniref:VIT1/CCC1 transporter family protein n=1 Tax=Promineifilum sp. TaxID=2664178 RepID=UPI0035AEC4B1